MKASSINLTLLAASLEAYHNCVKSGNQEWEEKHKEKIEEQLKNLPHGSGIDCGVNFLWEESNPDKLVFNCPFHHMDENGYYDGWTDYKIIVTSEFGGFKIRITGRDKNQIKEYLSEIFYNLFTV